MRLRMRRRDDPSHFARLVRLIRADSTDRPDRPAERAQGDGQVSERGQGGGDAGSSA